MTSSRRFKAGLAGTALVAAGFGAGAVVALTGSASAATDTPADSATGVAAGTGSSTSGPGQRAFDPSKSMRPDEHLLTGSTAAKVRAAALAKYPKATIERVETDSDGVYEAHVVTSAGQHLIVQVGKDFAVTGTDRGPGAGGPRGDHDGDGSQGPPPSAGSGYGA